jgi:phosphoenolpyruvate carboxylase
MPSARPKSAAHADKHGDKPVRKTDKDLPLIEDIRLLGRILGDVIREQEGGPAYELVEQVRQLSVAFRRDADEAADKALKKLLKGLSSDQTVSVIRAFTYFSHLANLAEDRHHIRRRAVHERAGNTQEGSIEVALARLRWAGISTATVVDTLAKSFISPVLTAHPTEVQRQSILTAERRIAQLLAERDDILMRAQLYNSAKDALTPRELTRVEAQLRACVAQLWQTRLLRHSKLTVADEIENALSYYEATFLQEIPKIYEQLEQELGEKLPEQSFLRMGQWIGGDRDGNPFVTAESLELALTRQADVALRHYLREVHYLGGELSLSANLVDITPEMQALADASPDHNVHRSDEPYRRALTGIYARLAATLRQLTGGEAARHAVAPQNAYASADAFLADLQIIDDSLSRYHGDALAPQRLRPLMRAVRVFGFYLSTVDLRQSSDKHEEVVRELLSVAKVELDYSLLEEDAKCALLVRLLEDARPARDGRRLRRPHAQRAGHLRDRQAPARAPGRRGDSPLHHQPHRDRQRSARGAAAAKGSGPAARHLQDGAQCDLIVVPLFETIEDLRNAAPIMRRYYQLPGIAELVRKAAASRTSCWATATATRTAASSPATGSCTGPRLRWSICLTIWPTTTASGCACSTAAAAPWGVAAAPATRPSWRSRRARCAVRSA